MKLSQLIDVLSDLEAEHGDEEVRVPFYSGGLNTIAVTGVECYDGPDTLEGNPYVLIEAS